MAYELIKLINKTKKKSVGNRYYYEYCQPLQGRPSDQHGFLESGFETKTIVCHRWGHGYNLYKDMCQGNDHYGFWLLTLSESLAWHSCH